MHSRDIYAHKIGSLPNRLKIHLSLSGNQEPESATVSALNHCIF